MLTSGTYVRRPEVLQLQSPIGPASGSDERLFIVVHQAYELRFMLLLDALEETRGRLLAGELHGARRRLARVISLQRLLLAPVALFGTMSPAEIPALRGHLCAA